MTKKPPSTEPGKMPSDPAPLLIIVRLPGRPTQALTLEAITARVRARTEGLKMGRFADRFKATQAAIDALDDAATADLDKIDTRTVELHKKREDVMTRKLVSLDERMGTLTEFGKDLDDFDRKNDRSGGGSDGNAYTGVNKPKS